MNSGSRYTFRNISYILHDATTVTPSALNLAVVGRDKKVATNKNKTPNTNQPRPHVNMPMNFRHKSRRRTHNKHHNSCRKRQQQRTNKTIKKLYNGTDLPQ